jgi:hypothetical protein
MAADSEIPEIYNFLNFLFDTNAKSSEFTNFCANAEVLH